MRVVTAVFLATGVAWALGAGPSLAKTSELAKTSDKTSDAPKAVGGASSPPCHAYEQNPDGSWKELACQEEGPKPPPASRISKRDAGKATR
jgi:hypothetical protein